MSSSHSSPMRNHSSPIPSVHSDHFGRSTRARVSHESTETLGLAPGVEAIALIKASWVMIAIEDDGAPYRLSARNRLLGTVSRLTPGAVNTEVVLELKGGKFWQ